MPLLNEVVSAMLETWRGGSDFSIPSEWVNKYIKLRTTNKLSILLADVKEHLVPPAPGTNPDLTAAQNVLVLLRTCYEQAATKLANTSIHDQKALDNSMTDSLKPGSKEALASLTHCSSLAEGAVTLLEDYVDSLDAIAQVMNTGVKLTKAIEVWGTEYKTRSNQVHTEEEEPDSADPLRAPVDLKMLRAALNESNKHSYLRYKNTP